MSPDSWLTLYLFQSYSLMAYLKQGLLPVFFQRLFMNYETTLQWSIRYRMKKRNDNPLPHYLLENSRRIFPNFLPGFFLVCYLYSQNFEHSKFAMSHIFHICEYAAATCSSFLNFIKISQGLNLLWITILSMVWDCLYTLWISGSGNDFKMCGSDNDSWVKMQSAYWR